MGGKGEKKGRGEGEVRVGKGRIALKRRGTERGRM